VLLLLVWLYLLEQFGGLPGIQLLCLSGGLTCTPCDKLFPALCLGFRKL
jgi:hypothetical protein